MAKAWVVTVGVLALLVVVASAAVAEPPPQEEEHTGEGADHDAAQGHGGEAEPHDAEQGHGDEGGHHGVQLASWRWDAYSSILTFLIMVILAGVLKLLFHHAPILPTILPGIRHTEYA